MKITIEKFETSKVLQLESNVERIGHSRIATVRVGCARSLAMVWAVLPTLLVATVTGGGNELTGWSEEFTTEIVGSGGYALPLCKSNILDSELKKLALILASTLAPTAQLLCVWGCSRAWAW